MNISQIEFGFFLWFILISTSGFSQSKVGISFEKMDENVQPGIVQFDHGVASGDPLSDRVIIWTRVTAVDSSKSVVVTYEIDEDKDFLTPVKTGTTTTDSNKDFTINVDVIGLSPGTVYYYRFESNGVKSMIGTTKTASLQQEKLDIAVVSCSNYEWGYFSGYAKIAEKELDVVLHLGDYIYEYASGVYGDKSLPRKVIPNKELITLQDYRTRYAQYRLDEDLQAVHRSHPFILIWDDHEFANNAYIDGAQNHQSDEGNYNERVKAARQAYYEWLPIRKAAHHYRSFSYGNIADIIMLDERMAGRKAPLTQPSEVDSSQTMLGEEQLEWFQKGLSKSKAIWKIIGNQVIFSHLDITDLREPGANMDAWDGYAIERDGISNYINQNRVDNVVFVTGDTHCSWAFDVPNTQGQAIEIATPSISSGNWDESRAVEEVKQAEVVLQMKNEHLKYVNLRDHGYLLVHLSKERAEAKWMYIDDVKSKNAQERIGYIMEKKANVSGIGAVEIKN